MKASPFKIPHPFRKLNKELIDKLVDDISKGSTHKLAALSNNISERIFDMWRNQGVVDIEFEKDTLCAYFVLSLSKVKKEEVVWCRKKIKNSDKGHKGAEWTLEHAYWRDYGKDANAKDLAEELDSLRSQMNNGDLNDEANDGEEK